MEPLSCIINMSGITTKLVSVRSWPRVLSSEPFSLSCRHFYMHWFICPCYLFLGQRQLLFCASCMNDSNPNKPIIVCQIRHEIMNRWYRYCVTSSYSRDIISRNKGSSEMDSPLSSPLEWSIKSHTGVIDHFRDEWCWVIHLTRLSLIFDCWLDRV